MTLREYLKENKLVMAPSLIAAVEGNNSMNDIVEKIHKASNLHEDYTYVPESKWTSYDNDTTAYLTIPAFMVGGIKIVAHRTEGTFVVVSNWYSLNPAYLESPFDDNEVDDIILQPDLIIKAPTFTIPGEISFKFSRGGGLRLQAKTEPAFTVVSYPVVESGEDPTSMRLVDTRTYSEKAYKKG